MKVFKFGGASLKNAQAIKNVASILKGYIHEELLVVVSAMGKTTNALERIVALSQANQDFTHELADIRLYHHQALTNLNLTHSPATKLIDDTIEKIKTRSNPNRRLRSGL